MPLFYSTACSFLCLADNVLIFSFISTACPLLRAPAIVLIFSLLSPLSGPKVLQVPPRQGRQHVAAVRMQWAIPDDQQTGKLPQKDAHHVQHCHLSQGEVTTDRGSFVGLLNSTHCSSALSFFLFLHTLAVATAAGRSSLDTRQRPIRYLRPFLSLCRPTDDACYLCFPFASSAAAVHMCIFLRSRGEPKQFSDHPTLCSIG